MLKHEKLPSTNWRSLKFCKISAERGKEGRGSRVHFHFPEFVQNFSERQILWILCSVDFHTLLPIETLHSVVPELQVL